MELAGNKIGENDDFGRWVGCVQMGSGRFYVAAAESFEIAADGPVYIGYIVFNCELAFVFNYLRVDTSVYITSTFLRFRVWSCNLGLFSPN